MKDIVWSPEGDFRIDNNSLVVLDWPAYDKWSNKDEKSQTH